MIKKLFGVLSQSTVNRHDFYLIQWQRDKQVGIIYLLYRWIIAIVWLSIVACSLLDFGRSDLIKFDNHVAKWFIYLTHWGLLMGTIQACCSVCIVTQGIMMERIESENETKISKFCRFFRIIYTLATVYSFLITILYWTLDYNPETHDLDALNIMIHVFNAVLMFIDLIIVRISIQLSHACWTVGVGVVYLIFSYIYFAFGGTSRELKIRIYSVLDWTKLDKAIPVSVGVICFIFLLHLAVYCIYRLRLFIFNALYGPSEQQSDNKSSKLSHTNHIV